MIQNHRVGKYLYLEVTPWPLEDVGALTPPSPNRAAHANKSKGVIIRGFHRKYSICAQTFIGVIVSVALLLLSFVVILQKNSIAYMKAVFVIVWVLVCSCCYCYCL